MERYPSGSKISGREIVEEQPLGAGNPANVLFGGFVRCALSLKSGIFAEW